MRRFIENTNIKSLANINMFSPEHLSIFNSLLGSRSEATADEILFAQTTFISGNFTSMQDRAHVKLMPPFVLHHFDSVSLSYLRICYQNILPRIDILRDSTTLSKI